MTEQTIAELTNFFQQFKVGGDKTPAKVIYLLMMLEITFLGTW